MTAATLRVEQFSDEEIDSLTTEELEALVRADKWAEASQSARTSHLDFIRFTMPHPEHYQDAGHSRFDVQPHHRLLADALEEVFSGRCLRLIISMPPQHGKTETLTRRGLAFHVGRFPWKHLLMGTYNQTYADEIGEDVRAIMNSEEYKLVFPHVKLRQGSKAKDHMVTEDGGKISFLGRGGSGTGRPADGLLIDDPFKDAREADSKAIRDDAWQWFTRVGNTRCHTLTWQIIICTRWSDDDIVARLTDPKNPFYKTSVAKQWTVINLPAILDNEELATALGRKVGEPLWPGRFSKELLQTARDMDPVGFSALYMGRPTPPEGSFYKEFMLSEYDSMQRLPKRARFYLTGDLAVSPELRADKSCVGVWLLDENDELWLHPELYWDRKSSDESVDKIIELGSRYKVSDSWWEKGQLEKAIGPFFTKRHMELVRAGKEVKSIDGARYKPQYFNIVALPVAGSKGLRSTSIRGRMAQRKVHFPSFAPWWSHAKECLLKFTGSGNDKEDDFCDMIALIGQALDDQVAAPREEQPKIVYPKVGTLAWTKWAHDREKRERKVRVALAGM